MGLSREEIEWIAKASADEIRRRYHLPPRRERPETKFGTCYEDALRFLIREEEGHLIHGTVLTDDERIGHAWVETLTTFVWEPETKKFYPKDVFRAFSKAIEEQRYTPDQAAVLAMRTHHTGPWTEEERRKGGYYAAK